MTLLSSHAELRALRIVGFIEGVTLLSLLGVAVPLKRLMHIPEAVSVMGPVHGLTVVLYMVLTLTVVSGGGWSAREAAQTAGAAFLPFGTFLNDRMLARKLRERSA